MMHEEIKIVALSITTYCNMKCPECCAAMQSGIKKNHVDWDYMVHAAKHFKGIETIDICGGEATIHPNIREWAPKLKELFGCKYLTIDTNASMFKIMPDLFEHFDKVYVSTYPDEFYDGWKSNESKIEYLKNIYPDKLHIGYNIIHTPRDRRGYKPCERAYSGTIRYEDGRVYPCCIGSGLDTLVSVPLTENWRKDLDNINPPCGDCFLSL